MVGKKQHKKGGYWLGIGVSLIVFFVSAGKTRGQGTFCCLAADCAQGQFGTGQQTVQCVGASAQCGRPTQDGLCKTTAFQGCSDPPGYSAWTACGSDFCQDRYCISSFELQIRSCGGGVCGQSNTNSGCGNAVYPTCSGVGRSAAISSG